MTLSLLIRGSPFDIPNGHSGILSGRILSLPQAEISWDTKVSHRNERVGLLQGLWC
jgi:hypothetical protein